VGCGAPFRFGRQSGAFHQFEGFFPAPAHPHLSRLFIVWQVHKDALIGIEHIKILLKF
jgi:hypothetical protein